MNHCLNNNKRNNCPYHNVIVDSCNYCIAISNNHKVNSAHTENKNHSCCGKNHKKSNLDWLFLIGIVICASAYIFYKINLFINLSSINNHVISFTGAVYSIANEMVVGIILGTISIFLLNFIPKPMLYKILGHKKGISSILRAIIAGVVLDVCSCGVYLIAAKLYKQGVRLSQIIAFLCATPWNSLSVTFVMVALIGLKLTIIFILLSLLVAIFTALVFEYLLSKKILPANKNTVDINDINDKEPTFKEKILSKKYLISTTFSTLKESKIIIKWLLIGTIVAAIVRAFVPDGIFQTYFGPSVLGLLTTSAVSLLVETCSQGTLPLAAEFITKAGAVGNAFTFLMMGVATNISQALVLKEIAQSWKVPVLLALITIPQIIILGFILNNTFKIF